MRWEFVAACAFRGACRRIPWREGGVLGFGEGGVFCGGVFRFGNKHFGAAYHLRDEYHILNILWGDDMG